MLSELLSCVRCRGIQAAAHQCQITSLRLCSSVTCNHYDVLGVHKNATKKEIREAFVNLSKELHPDRNPDDPSTHQKFVRINEAYTVLSKPKSRGDYDLQFAMYERQRAAQAATSYSYGGSHRPGTGFSTGSDYDERAFWDETIFHMRDRGRDMKAAEIKEDEYYGIKGLRKVSHSTIVVCTIIFLGLGTFLQFGIITGSSKKSRSKMNEIDQKAGKAHRTAVERARLHGNKMQLEILKQKLTVSQDVGSESAAR